MKKYWNNYAFIGSQNLNLAIEQQGWKLDFKVTQPFFYKFRFVLGGCFVLHMLSLLHN